MSGTQRIDLNELISPSAARVVVRLDEAGQVQDAEFDLTGLPRVDQMLVGRPVAEVPGMVERLCGICPAAHHLAGVAALEGVLGIDDLPETARKIRKVLHLASVLDNHAVRLFPLDREAALTLRRFAKQAMAAVGSPGHFPATAVPGGVVAVADEVLTQTLLAEVSAALAAAGLLAERQLATAPEALADYGGAEVALVDEQGRPDLFGVRLRALRGAERVLDDITPDQWVDSVAEERTGEAAPRPYLLALGSQAGSYRVGPVSQLRVGELVTPQAAALQERWLTTDGSALSARAVLSVHCVEALAVLLSDLELTSGAAGWPLPPRPSGEAAGTGWVDGPRGLLVHHYRGDEAGRLVAAQILTPTAQNERWLADLLREAVGQEDESAAAEASIREADPCLPCTSAPAGAMDLTIEVEVD